MPTPPSPPARQRRKQARPQELLDAALELFVEKGFAATRSEEVATRAGVSKGTLYLYYPSKEELLKAVIRHNLTGLIAEGSELVDAFEGSSAELLTLMMRTWWHRVSDTPASGIFKIMLSEARNFPELAAFYNAEVIAPAEAMIRRALQRGVERGEFRTVATDEITLVLSAPILFMALHKHSLGACGIDDLVRDGHRVVETHIDVVLHGLALAGDGAPRPAKKKAARKP